MLEVGLKHRQPALMSWEKSWSWSVRRAAEVDHHQRRSHAVLFGEIDRLGLKILDDLLQDLARFAAPHQIVERVGGKHGVK
ncbi:MAG: hypothetical protein ACXWVI_09535 [Methyloceanibacter sp.]